MRSSKIMSFSVPPEFEEKIQKLAKREHRTISEFLREAVRQYMATRDLEETRQKVSARLAKEGVSENDVEDAVAELRNG
jgi:CopG family transcriptional regulator/antitoxin EndoAI